MRRTWRIKPVDEEQVDRLSREISIPPLIAKLLIHRGADSPAEAGEFLCADLSALPDPQRMADLGKAVSLLREAVRRREPILLMGDYDADGLTGAALLYRAICRLGTEPAWHIPHRETDGYGLKKSLIQKAASSGVKLLITVDCGTTSFEELKLARALGMETIVLDHHELLPAGRPPASAFLNPLQPGCSYPTKSLASVGVVFTLARGLLEKDSPGWIWDQLDLVALGTVADLAPLTGENRILVKRGLHCLQGTQKPGLRALLSRTQLEDRILTSEAISFTLAPRLNAMGRIGSAEASFRLLVTEDPEEARDLAKKMDQQNKVRATLGREAFRRALAKVEREIDFSRDRVIVLEDERWHQGVVGIVATRLTAQFHRPSVVIALQGTVGRGSARSIRAFSLVEALGEVKEHLLEFGGHPGAAGFTIARGQVGRFREALNRVAHQRIDSLGLTPFLEADQELPLSSLTQGLLRDLELLAPFGPGNPWPIFLSRDARLPLSAEEGGQAAASEKTAFDPWGIRFTVEDSNGRPFQVLQPRQELSHGSNPRALPPGSVHLAYSPVRCQTDSGHRIELKLHDLKLS